MPTHICPSYSDIGILQIYFPIYSYMTSPDLSYADIPKSQLDSSFLKPEPNARIYILSEHDALNKNSQKLGDLQCARA